jgi:hypothetical protein
MQEGVNDCILWLKLKKKIVSNFPVFAYTFKSFSVKQLSHKFKCFCAYFSYIHKKYEYTFFYS